MVEDSRTDVPATVTIPRIGLVAAGAAVAAIIVLLVMVLVVLMSTRERSVSLDAKSSRLLLELTAIAQTAEPALHAADSTLDALPQTPAAARRSAASARQLSAETHRFLLQLRAAGLPGSLGSLTKLPTALVPLISVADAVQEQNQLPALVGGLSQLTDTANRDGLVSHASALLTQTPALLATLNQVRGLLAQITSSRLVPVAARALEQIPAIRSLLSRSLQVQDASHSLTQKTVSSLEALSPVIDNILSIGEQTLTHAASLDRKVGVVP
jgi:hypothetical protein